jgi:protein TonB
LPPYPASAKRRNIEGYVIAELLVGERGDVREVLIIDRRGPPSFEQAVRETVASSWAFEPGQYRGQPVPVWTRVQIDFRLR